MLQMQDIYFVDVSDVGIRNIKDNYVVFKCQKYLYAVRR